MKRILILSFFLASLFSAKSQTIINDTGSLRAYINAHIVTNFSRNLTAQEFNDVLNGVLNSWPNDSVSITHGVSYDTLFYWKNRSKAFYTLLTRGGGGGGSSDADSMKGNPIDTSGRAARDLYYWDPLSATYKFRAVDSNDVKIALGGKPVLPSDTAAKWIGGLYKRNDSVFTCIGGVCSFSYIDVSGSADSGTYYTKFRSDTARANMYDSLYNRLVHVDSNLIRSYSPFVSVKQQIYLDAGNKSGIFYYDNTDVSSVDDSCMIFVTSGGARWKRLVTVPYLDSRWFGTVGNGAVDDYPALQKGINFAVKNTSYPRDIKLPMGNYNTSAPLIIANFNGSTYSGVTVNLIGQGNARNAANAVTIQPQFTNTFAIGIQQGKSCRIQNLNIIGKYSQSASFGAVQIDTLPFSAWDDGVCRQDVHSPYAGVAIDPFSDSTRYPSSADMYPGLHAYCPAGMSTSGSTDIELDHCRIAEFIVGFIVTPSYQFNGEMVNVNDSRIDLCKVAYATCQAQSKNNHVTKFMCWGNTHTIFDNVTYGKQALDGGGDLHVDGANIAGNNHQLGNINVKVFKCDFKDIYAESLFKLGYFTSVNAQTVFEDCDINYQATLANLPYPDFFVNGTNIVFKNCKQLLYTANAGTRMILSGVNVVWDGGVTNSPPISYTDNSDLYTQPSPTYKDVSMFYSHGVLGQNNISNFNSYADNKFYTQNPIYPTTYELVQQRGTGSGNKAQIKYNGTYERWVNLSQQTITVNKSNWTGFLKVSPASDTNLLKVNDFLISGYYTSAYQDQFSTVPTSAYPIGLINKISHDTVFFQNVAWGVNSGTILSLSAYYYQYGYNPITGNLASGASYITKAQTPDGVMPVVGSRLDLPQFAPGTFVTAVNVDTIKLSTANLTGQSFTDYTWYNGYPDVKFYRNAAPENTLAEPLIGGALYYQNNSTNLYTGGTMGNNYTNSYFIVNSNFQGDTVTHKLKYYPILTKTGGDAVSLGTTAQRQNGTYMPASVFRVNTDSANHAEIWDGSSYRTLAYKTDITGGVGAGNYQTIQLNGTAKTVRPVLNFSSSFTATDNSGNTSTDIGLSKQAADTSTNATPGYQSAWNKAKTDSFANGLITQSIPVKDTGAAGLGVIYPSNGGIVGKKLHFNAPLVATQNPDSSIDVRDTSSGTGGATYSYSNGVTNTLGNVTNDLITGKAGGQTVVGDTSSGGNLTLTSNNTVGGVKGKINLGSLSFFDEANQNLRLVDTLGNTIGLQLWNTKLATSSVQQISPILSLRGNGYKTAATAGSQTVDGQIYVTATSGIAAPTAGFAFNYSINGGTSTNMAQLFASGLQLAGAGAGAGLSLDNSTPVANNIQMLLGGKINNGNSGSRWNNTTGITFSGAPSANASSQTSQGMTLAYAFANTGFTNSNFTSLFINPNFAFAGGGTGIGRGLYVKGTYAGTFDFRAIETDSGKVIFNHVPVNNFPSYVYTKSSDSSTAETTLANLATAMGAPQLQISQDLTTKSGSQSNFCTLTSQVGTHTYSIGGYLHETSAAGDVIQLQVTYTDESGTSQTLNIGATVSTTTPSAISPIIIRVNSSTAINISTVITGGGSTVYNVGGFITYLY